MSSRRRERVSRLMAAVVAMSLVACQAQIDQNRAVEIARTFVVAGEPSGYAFLELTNEAPQSAGSAWRVKVDAHIRISQSPPQEAFLHFVIDVDRGTGTPTIHAQG
jgi:hypothetical protein